MNFSNVDTFSGLNIFPLLLYESQYLLCQFLRFANDVETVPDVHHFYRGQYEVALLQKALRLDY